MFFRVNKNGVLHHKVQTTPVVGTDSAKHNRRGSICGCPLAHAQSVWLKVSRTL